MTWQDHYSMSQPPVLCDLDGVVWLAHRPIDGAADAVAALRAAGHRVVFVTNNSSATVAEQEAALNAVGISAEGDVITSAAAGGSLVGRGETVLVCGGAGVVEAVVRAGAIAVDARHDSSSAVDAVVVGFHRWFDYEVMRRAATAVRAGARLIGTNDDPTYPTPEGPIPGGGSILAAVATAAGVAPIVAGKPHAPMAEHVRALLGVDLSDAVMVGDRPSTDGRFAATLGCRFALVRTGVTAPGSRVDEGIRVDIDAPDLFAVARHLGAV